MNVTADPVREIREEAANKAAEAARAVLRDAPLVSLMGTEQGREHVWLELEPMRTPVGRADMNGRWDDGGSASAAGIQSVAIALWGRLWDACPELVALMVTEASNRKRAAK